MKPAALATAALLLAGSTQAATVEVEFVAPEKFTDIGSGRDADAAQAALARQLKSLGEQHLPARQLLKISILDVDLAGQQPQATARGSHMRVMGRGVDWPRIHLRYTLSDGGQPVAEGEDRLTDMNYLERKATPRSTDPLPYETRLLTDWFNGRFKASGAR